MKILIVGQEFVLEESNNIIMPGGTERYIYSLSKQLIIDGYEVNVLSTTTNRDKIGWNVVDGIRTYFFRLPGKYYGYLIDFLAFFNTLKIIMLFSPDIVHIISTRYRFAVGTIVAAKLMKKKTVCTITTLPHSDKRKRLPVFLDKRLFVRVVKKVDVIISLSTHMGKIIEQQVQPKKIVMIPNPLMKCHCKKTEKERNSVLCVGRLDLLNKGVSYFIQMLPYLKKEIPNIKLHVCGTCDHTSQMNLLKLISEYKPEENIIFHGHLSDEKLGEKYSSSEVIVLPSFTEGAASYVLIEAMSAGLPIVSFDIEPSVEALGNGKYGLLVKKGDVRGLADCCLTLLKNEKLRKFYAQKSLERSELYTQAKIVERIEEVYSSL